MVKPPFNEDIYAVGTHWNCLYQATTYVSKIRKTTITFTLEPSCPLSLPLLVKHLKLPISIEIPVTIAQIVLLIFR